jgi:nitrogen fixation protein NifB
MTPPPTSALASAPTATPELDITLTKTQTKVNKSDGCGCSTTSDPATEMSESLKARIENHPCYSEEAHHHYARMHVAVAPPATFNATTATANTTAPTKAAPVW